MLKSIQELVAEAANGVDRISIEQALEIENVIMVDCREPAEIAAKSIRGSINIPRGVMESKITELTQDPQAPICIHCASGTRAVFAAEQLIRLGFSNVKAISSGVDHIHAVTEARGQE